MARQNQGKRAIKLPVADIPADPYVPADGTEADVLQNIHASAQLRDRSKLPSKVRVITPQVILNIVRGITDRFGDSVDRGELDQLVLENTQMRMQLEQNLEKLDQYKTEYKKVYERFQSAQQMLQQVQTGDANTEDLKREYEALLADWQRRNAEAVDIYTDVQRQLDETLAQYDQLQAELHALQSQGQGTDNSEELAESRAIIVELRQQIEDMQGQSAEAAESYNQEYAARTHLEAEAARLREELEQARAGLPEDAAEQLAARDAEIEKLNRQLREAGRTSAKSQNMELELEQLRAAEGQWLEEKRRMASQLVNETSNRQAAEERLQAIESGAALPASAKAVEDRAKAAEKTVEETRKELEQARKELETARATAAKAEPLAGEVEKLKADLKKLGDELKSERDAMSKAGNAVKELAALNRKYENVESELEGLRAAEGKWLEEKRRLAAQLTNETNMRRELEARLSGELASEKAGRESDKKKISELESAAASAESAVKAREVAERSIKVLEAEIQALRTERDRLKSEHERLAAGGGEKAAELARQLEKARKTLAETERKLATRHEHVAKLAAEHDAARAEIEKLRKELADARTGQGAELTAANGKVVAELKATEAARAELGREVEQLRKLLEDLNDAQKADARSMTEELEAVGRKLRDKDAARQAAEQRAARVPELEGKLKDREVELAEAQRQLEGLRNLEGKLGGELAQARGAEQAAVKEVESLKRRLSEAEDKLAEARKQPVSTDKVSGGRLAVLERELEAAKTRAAQAQQSVEKTQADLKHAHEKAEQAAERRFEIEKQLVEVRTRAESDQRQREELSRRVKQLEQDLDRERASAAKAAPAEALQNLNSQLAAERARFDAEQSRARTEIDDLHRRLAEAELRENELSSQLEGIELSQQDVMRAKALAGQRRAQIERMQADVESARRRVKETEAYWKSEMQVFMDTWRDHVAAAERGDEGADARLVRLLETLKVGVFEKYATLRRKHNRTTKELDETREQLEALERIIAKREGETKPRKSAKSGGKKG